MAISNFFVQNTLELEKIKMLPLTHAYCTLSALLLFSPTYYTESLVNLADWLNDILRDPIWDFLGVIAALVTIYLSLREFQRKDFLCEVAIAQNILDFHSRIKEKLEVKFKNNLVNNLFLLLIDFINIGKIAITKEDYSENLRILFEEDTMILDTEVINQNPRNLRIKIIDENDSAYNPQAVSLKPVLLNPKDSFRLMILASNHTNSNSINFEVDGRIVGIRSIRRELVKFDLIFWSTLILAGSLTFMFLFNTVTEGDALSAMLTITFMLSLIGLIRKKLTESQKL